MKNKIIFLIIGITSSIIFTIEIVNNILFSKFLETEQAINEKSMMLLRMELWPIHLGMGIILSIALALYLVLNKRKIYEKFFSITNVLLGLFLIAKSNNIILVVHIILSMSLLIWVLYLEFKQKENFNIFKNSFLISIICFIVFIKEYISKEVIYDNIEKGYDIAKQGATPIKILSQTKILEENISYMGSILLFIAISALLFIFLKYLFQNEKA